MRVVAGKGQNDQKRLLALKLFQGRTGTGQQAGTTGCVKQCREKSTIFCNECMKAEDHSAGKTPKNRKVTEPQHMATIGSSTRMCKDRK